MRQVSTSLLWKHTLMILCAVAPAMVSDAQTQVQRTDERSYPLVQQFLRQHGQGWTVHLSADKKRIESIVGLGSRSYGEKPEGAARQFLSENAEMFALRKGLEDMRVQIGKRRVGKEG